MAARPRPGAAGEGAAAAPARGQRELWGGRELGKGSGLRPPPLRPPRAGEGAAGGAATCGRGRGRRGHTHLDLPPHPRPRAARPPPPVPHGRRDSAGTRGALSPASNRGGGCAPNPSDISAAVAPPRSLAQTGPSRQRPPEGRGCACRRCPRGGRGKVRRRRRGPGAPGRCPPALPHLSRGAAGERPRRARGTVCKRLRGSCCSGSPGPRPRTGHAPRAGHAHGGRGSHWPRAQRVSINAGHAPNHAPRHAPRWPRPVSLRGGKE